MIIKYKNSISTILSVLSQHRLMCLWIVACTRVCHHVETELSIDQLSRKCSRVQVEASTCLIVYVSEAELVPGVMRVRHARRR